MGVSSSQNAPSMEPEETEEAPFPLMQLNNELLAGVTQRLTEQARRRFECVGKRAAAVTLAHGYIRRHELNIALGIGRVLKRGQNVEPQAIFGVCGLAVSLSAAPAAVQSQLTRHRRVTNLRLSVAVGFDNDWLESARQPLVAILGILLGSDRLKLTTVCIDARFGRCCDDVATSVARLVLRHADTIEDMQLDGCADDNGITTEHEHVELCQAVTACVGVQSFTLTVGDDGCLETFDRDCLPAFSQLRSLYFVSRSLLCSDALPRPSKLEELTVFAGWQVPDADGLTDMLLQRPDLFASLRQLELHHEGIDLPDGFLEASPKLQLFRVYSDYDCLSPQPSTFACDPLTYARQFMGQFFSAKGERHLCQLEVHLRSERVECAAVSEVCAKLLSSFHTVAADVAVACSDTDSFILGCDAILKAAVEANPAMAAVVGRAVEAVWLPNGADLVATAGAPLGADRAVGPLYTAMVAATGGRIWLDPTLAEEPTNGNVVYQLTRDNGANNRQLNVIVRWFEYTDTT